MDAWQMHGQEFSVLCLSLPLSLSLFSSVTVNLVMCLVKFVLIVKCFKKSLSFSPEAEQSSSPSRTGVGSDQEDSRTATMGNVKDLPL